MSSCGGPIWAGGAIPTEAGEGEDVLPETVADGKFH